MAELREITPGVTARITEDGDGLVIDDGRGEPFRLEVPEHGIFYAWVPDPRHGICVVVAFDPPAMTSGWSDWTYRIDVAGRGLERIGPRR